MMTLTASPRTIKTPITLPHRPQAAPTTSRPSFWKTLLRALSAPSA